jgi:capsular polysaccharide biosynthesis protein
VQIINQFDVPMGLHIHQYNEKSLNSELFRQAMIVIGMSSHTLSHIVWCLPGTQIIEIGYKTITREYYEISLQLKLDYWLTMIMNNKQIDPIDFRNVILKVFTRLS